MKNLSVLFSVFFIGSAALAVSNGGRGGGDAIQTPSGQWSLLDLAETLPYDYFMPLSMSDETEYEFSMAAYTLTFSCDYLVPGTTAQGPEWALHLGQAIDLLNERKSTRASEIKNGERMIGQQLVWIGTETPLENVGDEGVIRLIDPSSKKQVAVQKDGVVMVYMPIFRRFDAKNRAALVTHESLLRMVLKINPKSYAQFGTAKIRELVNLVFNKDFANLPASVRTQVCGPKADLFQ